jgi:hypothetical protein
MFYLLYSSKKGMQLAWIPSDAHLLILGLMLDLTLAGKLLYTHFHVEVSN